MGAIRATAAAVLIAIGVAASAADCVTEVRLLSTQGSVPNLVAGPSAWSGNVLAVAKTEEGTPGAIWVAIYGEGMETLVADHRIVTDATGNPSIIALLWNGLEFGLFYQTEASIRLQRLTTAGDPIGAPIAVNPTRRPRLGDHAEVVWSAALHAWVIGRHIASGTNHGIWVTVLETDGTVQRDEEIPAVPPAEPHLALAVTDTGVIGMFYLTTDDNSLLFTRIRPGAFEKTLSIVPTGGTNVQATTAGDLFVVARLVGQAPTAAIRWFVADSDHHLVRPDGVLVDGNGGEPVPLGLIHAEGELALTYSLAPSPAFAPDLRLHRFTVAGAFISDTRFAGNDLVASRALSSYPPVFSGAAYLTPAVRQFGGRLDSYLLRYCPLRAAIEVPRVVEAGKPVTLDSLVTGGVPPYEYAWSIVRDPGGASAAASITRTFTLTGPRAVTLVVTDNSGAQTTATFTIEVVDKIVEPPPPPVTPKRRAVRK
jgi:hypothetical protein